MIKSRIWSIFRFIILVGTGFVILYPLIYMVSCAFRDKSDMTDPTVIWIPRHPTIKIIQETMKTIDFKNTMFNTVIMNVGCSLVQVCSCSLTGYGFARFDFKGKKILFIVVIMMILVPVQVISMPLYSLFRNFGTGGLKVNLIDSMLTMYLPAITSNGIKSGLMILIFRQFFKGLPKELEDAAYIDGCKPLRTFVQIIAPNAKAAFLTVFLFSLVFYWNDYYVSSTFFTNTKTIALMLKNIDSELKIKLFGSVNSDIDPRQQIVWKEAACLLAITPVLVIYISLQKYFIEGIERSGITG